MFFPFYQNNSGGVFDKNLPINLIIEAEHADEANSRAESLGIYFDGVKTGRDCECCGSRWWRTTATQGEGYLIEEWIGFTVYRMDGSIEDFNYWY
jgi:hypothetical protein